MFEQDLVASRRLVDHELQIVGEEAIFHEPLSLPSHLREVVGLAGLNTIPRASVAVCSAKCLSTADLPTPGRTRRAATVGPRPAATKDCPKPF
jgi:hypothetical protein